MSKFKPEASYSSFCQPVPIPNSNLPLEITSKVADALANKAADLRGLIRIPLLNFIVSVTAAILERTDRGSNPRIF